MEKLPVLVRGHDHKTIAFDDEVVHDPGSFEEVYIRLIADMARVARYAEAPRVHWDSVELRYCACEIEPFLISQLHSNLCLSHLHKPPCTHLKPISGI